MNRPTFAVEGEPTKRPGPKTAAPAELAGTIFLLADDTPDSPHIGPDLFERELARQALWLAGHEEFGLRVRDASLGDTPAAALPGDHMFRIRHVHRSSTPWSVVVGVTGREHTLWQGLLAGLQYMTRPALCLDEHEKLSRGFYARCLAGAGFTPKPNTTSAAPVPAAAAAALEEMRETAQFHAVRLLHEEVRAKGESDALVAALARGYANLGLLTEFHWSSAPYVFKARGLLYAQRLVTRTKGSADSLDIRAYAAALAGLHTLALQDLTAAAKLTATDPKGATRLPWVEAIDAYVHFDLDRLAQVQTRSNTSLVRLLQFLATEAPETQAATISAGRAIVSADPECYRVHDSLCRIVGVSHLHGATLAGMQVFSKNLSRRLGEMTGLPAAVETMLDREGIEPDVYAALRAAGGTADSGEPSWSALAGVLQEVRFTQAWHRLIFMTEFWSVDPQAAAAEFAPLLDGHRLRPLIDSFRFDPRREPAEVRSRLLAAPVGDVDTKALAYYHRLAKVDLEAAKVWFQRASHGHGFLYLNLAQQARSFREDNVQELQPIAKFLLKASPHSPIGQGLDAVYGGPEVAANLAKTEAKYANHAFVQWCLGRRHLADKRPADAVRCWKRWAELSPSAETFRQLAGVYLTLGDLDRWKTTLEAGLKEEDTALFHAQTRVDLARYYMRKNDFARAEPYAAAAARSGAEWAYHCAAECQEGLGQWDAANALYEAATERYSQSAYTWYLACRASGQMDRAAAEAAVRSHLAQFGPGTTSGELLRAGRFYLLVGDTKEARPLIERANTLEPSSLGLLFAALLADAAGDPKACQAALDPFEKLPAEKNTLRPVGAALRAWSEKGVAPDAGAVDAALDKLPPGSRSDGEFCFGWYLQNRKLGERAVSLWKRCQEAKSGTQWIKTHARACIESTSRRKD